MTRLDDLFDAAKKVRENAYAPYSGFKVGAALIAGDGNLFAGCNVENASYPEGTCAEAGAIAAMAASGQTRISEVLVIADAALCTPCGGCRQKLLEFAAPETRIHIANLDGVRRTFTLAELLPAAFELEDKKD